MRIAMFMPALSPSSLGWKIHLDMADAMRRLGDDFEILTTANAADPEAVGAFEAAGVRALPRGGFLTRRLAGLAAPFLRSRALLPAASGLHRHLSRFGKQIDVLYVE